MKKLLFLLLICTVFAFCAAGCQETSQEEPFPSGDESPEPTEKTDVTNENESLAVNKACEQMNAALKQTPTRFSLQIETKNGSAVLHAGCEIGENYDASKTVSYTCEQYNTFVKNADGTYQIPSSRITTYTGNIKIKDGTVVERDGESLNMPIPVFTVRGLVFSTDCLTNMTFENSTFAADVTSPTDFFGTDMEAQNMKVKLTLQDNTIQIMQITYTAKDNTAVTIVYTLL